MFRRAAPPVPTCWSPPESREIVAAMGDPDPRTNGKVSPAPVPPDRSHDRRARGRARAMIAGFLTRRAHGRPFVTLKLATSLDGRIARPDGESRWITGPEARAHTHLERSRHEAILVGRGTLEADSPRLDVRLPGLESRSPRRVLLSRTPEPGWETIPAPPPSPI